MWRVAFAGWLGALALQAAWAQSAVFVSPSTQAQLTIACSALSLNSFEEQHYLAVAHVLADKLCDRPRIVAAIGLWRGSAENSGMIDGCAEEKARDLGALLGKYYHQKAALVFTRGLGGQASLVSFEVTLPLAVLSARMKKLGISGATIVPGARHSSLLMVTTSSRQRVEARRLFARTQGTNFKEEPGTAALLGDEDRLRARAAYNQLLSHASTDVQELDRTMYSEAFSDLGLESLPGELP